MVDEPFFLQVILGVLLTVATVFAIPLGYWLCVLVKMDVEKTKERNRAEEEQRKRSKGRA